MYNLSMTAYHSKEYDLTGKNLLKSLELPLLQYMVNKPVKLLQNLSVNFEKVESREADMIYDALIDEMPAIIHLEVQTRNDSTMLTRMLRYLTEIYHQYQKPVYQCVIYLGSSPVNMQHQVSFSLDHHSKLDYQYHLLALNQLAFADIAAMEPVDFLALLPLSQSQWDEEQHLSRSIQMVTERSQGMDFQARSDLLLKTEILAGLRFDRTLIEQICKEAMTMFQIEESSTYQMILEKGIEKGIVQGIEKGIEQGIQQGLEQGREQGFEKASVFFRERIIEILRKNFGPVPLTAHERLKGLNLEQLNQVMANALEAKSLDDFLSSLNP